MNVSRKRAGFSLVELLVVIAIIGVLVGLLLGGIIPWITGQKTRNTKALLKKLDHEVSEIYNEAMKTFRKNAVPPALYSSFGLTQGNASDDIIARAIWIKLQLKATFPMSYAEALQPWGGYPDLASVIPARTHFVKALQGRLPGMAANDPQTESAACLLIALKSGFGGRKFDADSILGASGMKDTDGDGVPEIVDGYGKAVGFCRWGTGYPALDALSRSTRTLDRDTEDLDHGLMVSYWNQDGVAVPSVSVQKFQALCHPIRSGINRYSYFTIPTIVSAGPDGSFGLDWYMTPQDSTEADNLYSFSQR
jgi:prepilin-type N-terminal cleavage/methylation domain-containing protein